MPKQPKKSLPSDNSPPSLTVAQTDIATAAAATMPLIYSQQIAVAQQSNGPLPPPMMLREYEEVSPGLTTRLAKMAEDEAKHRREMEAKVIDIQSRDQIAYRRT